MQLKIKTHLVAFKVCIVMKCLKDSELAKCCWFGWQSITYFLITRSLKKYLRAQMQVWLISSLYTVSQKHRIPLNFNYVATLPCEIVVFENCDKKYQSSIHYALSKYQTC